MSEDQKSIAAWTAVGILALAVVFMISLALTSGPESYYSDTQDGQYLILQWQIAAYFMKYGFALNSIFGAFLAGLSIMVTKVADIHTRKRDIGIIVILTLVGIGAATIALIKISSDTVPDVFSYIGEFGEVTNDEVIGQMQVYFGGFIGWFTTFLLAVLGISLASEDGVLNDLVSAD